MSDHRVSPESYVLCCHHRSQQRSITRLSGPGAETVSYSHRIHHIVGKALVGICWISSCLSKLHLRNGRGTFRATESGNLSSILSFVANYVCHLGLDGDLPRFPFLLSLQGVISHALHGYQGGRDAVALPTRSPLCAHRVE